MAGVAVITVGADRRNLVVTIVDENGQIVDMTSGRAWLQGRSRELSGKTINVDTDTAGGDITDPTQGEVTFFAMGSLVTQGELTAASIASAMFRLQVKYTDSLGDTDFTEEFELVWKHDPTVQWW